MISQPSPSISRAIATPKLRRAETISASATVPAEIRISSSASSAATQAGASGSLSTIAINAEVSTAITSAAVIIVEEVLAPRRAGSRVGLAEACISSISARGFRVSRPLDRNQPHRRNGMPGQHDLRRHFRRDAPIRSLCLGVGERICAPEFSADHWLVE